MKRAFSIETLAFALGAAALLFMGAAPAALAQEAAEGEAQEEEMMQEEEDEIVQFEEDIILEELVVTGSRAQSRTVTESAVPIDVVSSEEFVKQGGTDLADLLRNIVPSYNVNTQPISDAGTVVRPPNLRGLAPDHALVLVNGKRRHRAAVIHWLGNGVADGAQGPDLSVIPSIALKRVEVLRDGASAQYGSDAIAGVMNFQLKDASEGISIETKTGSFQDGDGKFLGDGELFMFAGNMGLGNEDAWANLSLEYGNSGETIRSVQRDDAAALEAAGNLEVANPAQIWGQPFIRDDIKFFANYGADLGESLDFYGHANYASKETEGGFYFRNPHTRSGVFKGPVIEVDGEERDFAADRRSGRRRSGQRVRPGTDNRPQAGPGGLAGGSRRPQLLLVPQDVSRAASPPGSAPSPRTSRCCSASKVSRGSPWAGTSAYRTDSTRPTTSSSIPSTPPWVPTRRPGSTREPTSSPTST